MRRTHFALVPALVALAAVPAHVAAQFSAQQISVLTGTNSAPGNTFNTLEGSSVSVFQSDGTANTGFSAVQFPSGSIAPVDITSGDVDGDGVDEIITLTGTNSAPGNAFNTVEGASISIRKIDGTAVPGAGFAISGTFGGSIAPVSIAAGDVDFDGIAEIIVLTGTNSDPDNTFNTVEGASISIREADGTPVAGAGFSISGSLGSIAPAAVAVGDVDGNGSPEILVLTGSNSNPGETFNTVQGASISVRAPDGSTIPGAPGFSISGSFGSIAPIDIAAIDQAVVARRIAVLTGANSDPGNAFNTVEGASVGIFDADGTSHGGFSASGSFGNSIVGIGVDAANVDFDVGDEIVLLTGGNSDPHNTFNTVEGASISVRDEGGNVLAGASVSSLFGSSIGPAGITFGLLPCSNCNDGSECPGDVDKDGLKDVWERRGFDADCDGTVEVDLPNLRGAGRGTNPLHMDLLVEIDFNQRGAEPTQAMVRAAKATMRAAPDVTSLAPNPDGVPGINLWLDTGFLRDPAGLEPSCTPGTTPCPGSCEDGVDNEGDGLADGADPDCLSGFGMEGVGPCNDLIDNDRDGLIDALPAPMGPDPDCTAGGSPNGPEGARPCNDGIDNDGDGFTDAAGNDPDCAVGDNLGRGGDQVSVSTFPRGGISGVDNADGFYTVKQAFFDRGSRQPLFHYAVFGLGFDPTRTETGATATEGGIGGVRSCEDYVDNDGNGLTDVFDPQCQTCANGADEDGDGKNDESPCRSFPGGVAEIGGNDLSVFNSGALTSAAQTGPDPGTFLHELGHNLNLGHGGGNGATPDHRNCKPNYVSIMNYQNQFGIAQFGTSPLGARGQVQDTDRNGRLDPFIIDYFPPRNQAGRSNFFPAGITIRENALNESVVFDAADNDNGFFFGAAGGTQFSVPMRGQDVTGDGIPDGIDWNGDGTINAGTVAVDIDAATSACPTGNPPGSGGNAGVQNTNLVAHDDWQRIELAFTQFPDGVADANNPSVETGARTADLLAARQETFATDVSMSIVPPAAIAPGSRFDLNVVVTDVGPKPTLGLTAHLFLPAGMVFVSSSANCQEYLAGTLDCTLIDIVPGDVLAFTVTLDAPTSGGGFVFSGTVDEPVANDTNASDNNTQVRVNQLPVCNAGGPYNAQCGGAQTNVTLNGSGSSDPDGDPITLSWTGSFTPSPATGTTPTVAFSGLGNFPIQLSVADPYGASTCSTSATVVDTLPPVIVANAKTVTRCTSEPVSVAVTATATDQCSPASAVTLTGKLVWAAGKALPTPITLGGSPANVLLPPGEARVEWRAVDGNGNASVVTQTVTVSVQETSAVCCAPGQTLVNGGNLADLILRPFSTPYCVFGNGGSDIVDTGSGKDFVAGGAGNDHLDCGFSSADTVSGGTGDDWIDLDGATQTIVHGGVGDDVIDQDGGGTVYGNAGNDYIDGAFGTQVIYPGPGKDTVHAGAGDDTIVIRNVCELAVGELLDGGLGSDTLITPVPVSELVSRGVILLGIQTVIVKSDEQYLSECF